MKTKQIFIVPNAELEGKAAHGQFLFDRPGLFMNFACEVDDVNVGKIEPWARKLDEFMRGDEPYLEFDSPHLPGKCYLSRAGAAHIVGVFPAWSDKMRAQVKSKDIQLLAPNGAEIPAPGALPILRKRPVN